MDSFIDAEDPESNKGAYNGRLFSALRIRIAFNQNSKAIFQSGAVDLTAALTFHSRRMRLILCRMERKDGLYCQNSRFKRMLRLPRDLSLLGNVLNFLETQAKTLWPLLPTSRPANTNRLKPPRVSDLASLYEDVASDDSVARNID